MKKTISTMIALALVATLAEAQQTNAPAPQPQQPAGDPIVIAAGDVTIRQSEFENAIRTLPQEYQQYVAGVGKKQFAEDYLRMKTLAAAGMKAGLDKDPEVVRQLNLMRENLVANAQLQRLEKSIVITDEDLRKYYEANKGNFEQVGARHILIAFKGSQAANPEKPELTEEQAKAKAEKIRAEIAAGASFEELAKKESDDTGSGANGGSLGEFGRGQMVPEFEQAVFAAKPGELTPVVRTQFGYHVIRVDSRDFTPFEQIKPMLERNQRQERLQAAVAALTGAAKATFNEAYFAAPQAPAAEVKQQ